MGLFSSDTKTTQNTQTTSQNTGFSEIQGSAASVQGSGNVVTLSDQHAIKAAEIIATGAQDFAGDTFKRSTDFTGDALRRLLDFGSSTVRESLKQVELASANTQRTASQAVTAIGEAARTESENVMIQGFKWAAIIAAVWAGAQVLRGWRG